MDVQVFSAKSGDLIRTVVVPEPEPVPSDPWADLRAERDHLLAASDPRALPDFPQTEASRAAWLAYRQALRDLPDVTSDPLAPVWPEPPQG